MRASRFGILLAGGWHCFCPGGWTDADADGGSNRTRGYATVRRDTESLDRSERVLAEEERVRLRPRLPVRAWKTHASKWDYIKGRFIITASRASGARQKLRAPTGHISANKSYSFDNPRAVKRQYGVVSGAPLKPNKRSSSALFTVTMQWKGSASYFIISWEPAFAHMK